MQSKMNVLRLIAFLLVITLLSCIPLVGAGLFYALSGNAYDNTYYAALPIKLDRLAQTPGERVIVVGGSSVAFGVDSKLVERELGMPCVNFGLYAAFGLKPMLDLSLPYLHRGDIVIIAPETTSQMYSAYCGYDYLLQALETRPGRLLALGTEYYFGLISKLPGYVSASRKLKAEKSAQNAGVYALSSFDAYGDIVYERPENTMSQGYSSDNIPELSETIVSSDFLNMINEYTARARKKGVSVFFSFCPINRLATRSIASEDMTAFSSALQKGLSCELLSPLTDHILDEGFFYDSNYHLNDTGAQYNSLLLVNDVQRVLGRMNLTSVSLPHAPKLENINAVLTCGTENGLIYDVTANGVVLTGLDETGRALREVVVPETIEGKAVISIASDAFTGCEAEKIVLPSTIKSLSGGLFSGAETLSRVELLAMELPEVSEDMLRGANSAVRLYVPSEMYGIYITDYFWGAYYSYLEPLQ